MLLQRAASGVLSAFGRNELINHKAKGEAMSNFLYVAVSCNNGQIKTNPEPIVLDPTIHHVVWWCDPLSGQVLTVRFPNGSPFLLLRREGELVIGSGNNGIIDRYPYDVEIQSSGVVCSGKRNVENTVQEESPNCPTVVCEANPSGPPLCHEVPKQAKIGQE